jgi:hypothetical protein
MASAGSASRLTFVPHSRLTRLAKIVVLSFGAHGSPVPAFRCCSSCACIRSSGS